MGLLDFSEELMEHISNMDRDNSVLQFSIPGKGKFTLVLQEEAEQSIEADIERNPYLGKMIQESLNEYKKGNVLTTSELLKSLSSEDFK
jgi:hypothetical protein